MPNFKIKETELMIREDIYMVEAETKEKAVELYCDKLAGSIEPTSSDFRYPEKDERGDIVAV